MKPIDIEDYVAEKTINCVLNRYFRGRDRVDAELGYSVRHIDGLADYGSYSKGPGTDSSTGTVALTVPSILHRTKWPILRLTCVSSRQPARLMPRWNFYFAKTSAT
jgi:hypothetical protein